MNGKGDGGAVCRDLTHHHVKHTLCRPCPPVPTSTPYPGWREREGDDVTTCGEFVLGKGVGVRGEGGLKVGGGCVGCRGE